MNRTARALTTLVATAALAVAGCGDDNGDDSTQASSPETTQSAPAPTTTSTEESGGGSDLKLSADPSGALKFDKDTLEGKAGKVTITMDNPSSVPHAIEVEGNGVEEEGETVGQGEVSKVTATLKPGKYEFYCPVPGHKEGGMEGTLTIE
ncbi:MAG TPA: plastocyanin/azurin family copper-binding protein [Thermoleophilaceae bacterium]|jgi:uncharacterized cupredoxin-like copper-binding protein